MPNRPPFPAPDRALRGKLAIVGLGETNYHDDYRAARAKAPGYEPPTIAQLIHTAFNRALDDSGLGREDIDGLSLSMIHGGPDAVETAQILGIKPQHCINNHGIMAGPLPIVCASLAAGDASVYAMVYVSASRSAQRQYGGMTYGNDAPAVPSSYYYYHPWGWSSQAAHWALMFTHYQAQFGVSEADLGAVAMQLREHASKRHGAVMNKPLTLDQYLESRYIVRPLHLFDLCLVNDGAVCLLVTDSERARHLPNTPVVLQGWGETRIKSNKMQRMVCERLRGELQDAAKQTFDMAGLDLRDVDHFEGYDPSTMHLINQIEGFGFADNGEGLFFCQDGQMTVGGRIPTNTGGGNLSGSYMHGWSQIAEIVRQLRHEAGDTQVSDANVSLYSLAQTDQVNPMIFSRGAMS